MSDLCDDIIAHIFSYLKPSILFKSCIRVNKLWHAILFAGNYDYLWREMCCAILKDENEEFEYLREANMKRKQIEYYDGLVGEGKLSQNWMELFLKIFKPLFALSREYKSNLNHVKRLQFFQVEESIHLQSCLRIVMNFQPCDEPLEIGASKYHGRPDLPKGFSWPMNSKGNYLLFACQLNLKDLQPFHSGKGILPNEGWLFFFTDFQGYYNPDERVCFYWNGPIEELKTAENPPSEKSVEPSPKESQRITYKEGIDLFTEEVFLGIFENGITSEIQSFVNREYETRFQLFGRPQPFQYMSKLIENDLVFLMHIDHCICRFYHFLDPNTMEISVKLIAY